MWKLFLEVEAGWSRFICHHYIVCKALLNRSTNARLMWVIRSGAGWSRLFVIIICICLKPAYKKFRSLVISKKFDVGVVGRGQVDLGCFVISLYIVCKPTTKKFQSNQYKFQGWIVWVIGWMGQVDLGVCHRYFVKPALQNFGQQGGFIIPGSPLEILIDTLTGSSWCWLPKTSPSTKSPTRLIFPFNSITYPKTSRPSSINHLAG